VVGFHPVRELLRGAPGRVRRVLIERGRQGQRRREIESLCRELGLPLVEVGSAELRRIGRGAATNGFGAEIGSEPRAAEPAIGSGDPELVVLAEDVQDPRNLGALLRVCEGAGVGRVMVREHGSAPLNEAAEKASAGASAWLAIERIGSAAQALERLKAEGFWVYGLDLGGEPPWEVDLTGKVVFCVGGEHGGLRRLTRASCDGWLTLPMRGRVGSLNLATAAAAVLYEAVRQRSRRGARASLSGPAEEG